MNSGGGYDRRRLGPGYFAHLYKAIFKQHHRELIPMLRRVLPSDGIVFDVGAHAGQFAKLFANLAPDGFVYAFEPQSYARGILAPAIGLNRLKNVAILPFGLGDAPGVAVLSVPIKRSGSHGFGLAHLGERLTTNAETEVIAVATVDEVVARLGLDRLDLIKADIEGWEFRLVKGAEATLRRLKPALMLEMNAAHLARAGDDVGTAWRFLTGLSYRPYDLDPERPLAPLSAPREGDILWSAKPLRDS